MTPPETQANPIGWIVAAAAAAVFVLDLLTPLGTAIPMLYGVPLLITWFVPGLRSTFLMIGIAMALILGGTAWSSGERTADVVVNRTMASVLLLVIGWLVINRKRVMEQRDADQAALRESEQRFAKTFRTTPHPIGITDVATGRCIEVNEACLQLFGFYREEVIGNTTLMLGIWPNQEDRERLIERLKAGEPVRNLELSFKTKFGELRHILVSSELAELSRTLCLITVGNDITERKQAEDKAYRAAAELAEAQRIAKLGSWRLDIATDRVWLSDQLYDVFNVDPSPSGEMYELFLARVHPDDRPGVVQANVEARAHGRPFDVEFRTQTKDGSVKVMREVGYANIDAANRVVGLFGTVQDITDRKESEERLRLLTESLEQRVKERTAQLAEANERWDWVVRATNDGVWDWDLLSLTAYFSPRWKEMHGFQARDPLESVEEWTARIHPDDRQSVLGKLQAYLDGKREEFWEEYRIQRKGGTYFWVLDRGIAIRDEQGRAVRMVGAETDITWRKKAETVLRDREAQLRELSARLLRAQEEERRRISRDLHDDIMQRMGALTLDLYGLVSSAASPDGALQSQIKACGASAEQLTTDLQRLAHQLHPSVLEYGGLEAAVREHVNEFASRTGVTAEFVARDVPKDLPLEHSTCLYRVMQEGLQNVQKHADANTVFVRLLGTGRGLGLCVHDDGHGFEEIEGAARRKGLGLTSMAERVGMLNGVFRIRTKLGDGTELHAWVPLKEDGRDTVTCAP